MEDKQKVSRKSRFKYVNLIYLFVIPLISLIALEAFSEGHLLSVYTWMREYPKQFFLNYALMFGIINIFYGLPRRAYFVISTVIVALFSVVGFISREKFVIKGSPLVPSDLSLIKEALNISDSFKSVYVWMAVIAIAAIVILFLIYKYIPKERYNWRWKVSVFVFSVVIITAFYDAFGTIQNAFALELINLSQQMNYDENGMMLGFMMSAEYLKVQQPADYSEDVIQQIVSNTKQAYSTNPDFKPNIIIVMSEAFWDPTLMKNVSFNQDPIPFFHSLQKSQTSGNMISPVYGGGTANTEFEALTGFSTQFLPGGSIPYTQYVTKPVEALPTVLKQQGYAASAIHTYDNWFYDRNSVYKDFGFDKFVSKEFYNDPEYHGQYIRDTELSQKILNEVKETDKPDFIYAVSMENHGPYSTTEDPKDNIKSSGSGLSADSKAMIDNYSSSISDVDQSLKQLIEGLQKIDEPTEVIFYGDHLPMLGDDYSVYKNAGFIQGDNSYQDYMNLHTVPFVTWNNFSTAKQHNLELSSNFMGTYALELAQKSGSPMTDFLSGLMKEGSDVVLPSEFANQEKLTPQQSTQYAQLQYDLLFGEQYTYLTDTGQKPELNTAYIQGDGVPEITGASVDNGVLTVNGNNFVENDVVYVDGKAAKTEYKGNNQITVALESKLSSKTHTLQIKLADSMKKVISTSNTYSLPMN